MNYQEFIDKHKLMYKAEFVAVTKLGDWDCYKWSVRIFRLSAGAEVEVKTSYHRGMSLKGMPGLDEVLDSLGQDAGSINDNPSFEDYANELGLLEDSSKAYQEWDEAVEQTDSLRAFLGEVAFEELIHEVETL